MHAPSMPHALALLAWAGAALGTVLPCPARQRATLDDTQPMVLATGGVPRVEVVVGRSPCPWRPSGLVLLGGLARFAAARWQGGAVGAMLHALTGVTRPAADCRLDVTPANYRVADQGVWC
jgi:hypothetical protein